MLNTADRIRQAMSFELIGLLIVAPLFAWLFGHSLSEMGVLACLGATAATAWNYIFNLAFDHALLRHRKDTRKAPVLRVIHAILFETTLLIILLPLFAWWLNISLMAALMLDLSFAAFYMSYTFLFTLGYDTFFPPQRSDWGAT